MAWGVDNGAFSRFDERGFLRLLDALHARRLVGCRFVAAPDVVGDATATLERFWAWRPRLRPYRFPLALVAQDGLTPARVPWAAIEALVIGGTTRFKLSPVARDLCAWAKARGKWVHVGRVNTADRLELFAGLADSCDGTATSKWGDVHIPRLTTAARRFRRPRELQRPLL